MFALKLSRGRWRSSPHLRLLSRWLVDAAARRRKRIIVTMPPRHGKSETCSVWFPAWYLELFQDHRIMLASYEANFAASWGRRVRNTLLENEDQLQVRVADDLSAADRWETTQGGGMMTAGVDGAFTGKGAHILLIDDPIKNAEKANSPIEREKIWNFYRSTAFTRLEPDGVVVIIMCMVGGTQVLMADGTKQALRDIRPGDRIATHEDGRLSASVVRNWVNQGPDCVFKIRMRSGMSVIANERHPFLVQRDGGLSWVRLREIKAGDQLVRVTGASGKVSSALHSNVTNQPSALGSACHTTERTDGPRVSGLRQQTPTIGDPLASNTGTGSDSKSIETCSQSSVGDAQSAENSQARMSERIGAGSSASTMTTNPAKSGRFSATTATSSSGTGRPSACFSAPLSTSDFTLDPVVAIEAAGCEDVFDIEVEKTHNFIADGVVASNTRWNEDDLAGRLIDMDRQASLLDGDFSPEPFDVLNLPALAEDIDELGRIPGQALWPERYDEKRLKQIRHVQGSYFWNALYQQHPIPPEGGGLMFREEWFPIIDEVPTEGWRWLRWWDRAATDPDPIKKSDPDWTIGLKLGIGPNRQLCVGDVVRMRGSPGAVKFKMRETAESDGTEVFVCGAQDPAAAGLSEVYSLKQMLKGFRCDFYPESGDKVVRAGPVSAECEPKVGEKYGNVSVVRADWNAAFFEILRVFPTKGKHDDDVDALSGAHSVILKKFPPPAFSGGGIGVRASHR
jgi:predicted phage terminase large subunit-like protein